MQLWKAIFALHNSINFNMVTWVSNSYVAAGAAAFIVFVRAIRQRIESVCTRPQACDIASKGLIQSIPSILGLSIIACLISDVTAYAETVRLNDSQDQAVHSSYDIKLAQVDAKIGKNEISEQRVDYYPKIQGQVNSEYRRSLDHSGQQVAVVGNTILPNSTCYQNAISLNATYTVFDYGIRRRNLVGAKLHAAAADIFVQQQTRDLHLKVLDAYIQALIQFRSLRTKQRALLLHHDLLAIKRRLFASGMASKLEAEEESLQVEKTFDEIQQAKQAFAESLKALSVLTHATYDLESTEIAAIEEEPFRVPILFVRETPEYRYYALELEKKRKELQVLHRQRYPQFSAYSNYMLYGSDRRDEIRAVNDFKNRTISFGLSATLPVFDGFKNKADCNKKKLEIERLKIERDQKLWELTSKHDKAGSDVEQYTVETSTKAMIISQQNVKTDMFQRLVEKKVSDKTELLRQQIQQIDHDLALEKASIQRIAAQKKLIILEAGG